MDSRAPLVVLSTCAAFLLPGCANITSGGPLPHMKEKPQEVCIIRNPRVTYEKGLPFLERAFHIRGIATHVVDKPGQCKKSCPWRLTYSIRRSWDWNTYLGAVNLALHKNNVLMAKADYEAGRFSYTKWGSADSRIDGVVGTLLGIN